MRVIAGTQKGRRLYGPKGSGLRPTADRVREALFSIIDSRVPGSRFLDLYAGTGSVGIEALSRGAQHVTFVESNPTALRILRSNLACCGFTESSEIYACSAAAFLKRRGSWDPFYHIAFADPPYDVDCMKDLWPMLNGAGLVTHDALLILEHSTRHAVTAQSHRFSLRRQYRYGDTTLSVFGVTAQESRPL